MNYSYFDFCFDLALFLKWFSFKVDILMKNEYYILFLIICLIFIIQIGVPLVLEHFAGESNDDEER